MKSSGVAAAIIVAVIVFRLIPDGEVSREADDKRAIEQLVDRFYSAMHDGHFDEAAKCYAAGTFDGTEIKDPAQALRMAYGITGKLEINPTVDALRLNGDEAAGEILIHREGIGSRSVVMVDTKTGKELGTWARTLLFVREKDGWKISGKDVGPNAGKMQNTLTKLQKLRETQKQNSRRLAETWKATQNN